MDAQDEAVEALYKKITELVGKVDKIGSVQAQASAVANLALAFRYTEGGYQPGAGGNGA